MDNCFFRHRKLASVIFIGFPVLALYLGLCFLSTLTDNRPTFFERGGAGWVVFASLYFGGLVGLICLSITHIALSKYYEPRSWILLLALIALFCLSNTNDRRDFDEIIYQIGYRTFLLIGQSELQDLPVSSRCKTVVRPWSRIEAQSDAGQIVIESGKGIKRSITLNGNKRDVELKALPDGNGLGDPKAWCGYSWQEFDAISKCYYSEQIMNFSNIAEALLVIHQPEQRLFPMVYTHDGLLIGWSTRTGFHSVQIVVWQVMIGGKKPTRLPYSDDSKIKLIGHNSKADK